MEPLQQLTRKQLDTLQRVGRLATADRGVPLKQLARALRVRSPTALGHLTILESLHLVRRHRGKTRLTRYGAACLEEYVRHHRVAETLFAEAGLSPEDSCEAAREVDLAISHRTVDSLCQAESHPKVCPHGAPISPCRPARGGG